MAFEHNELNGSLFDNDRKVRDNQPDMRGSCKIGGIDYWVSAWVKQGNKGEFLSLAFTVKDGEKEAGQKSTSKGSSFLSNHQTGQSPKAKSKFEREKEEFEKMTGGQVKGGDEFDDDIPF